jgi:hypothetical protein
VSVASNVNARTSAEYEYKTLTMIAGTMMNSRATTGTPRFSDTCAARSGRIRSNAAAKIIRVDDRNNVPDHPRNHAPNRTTIAIWKSGTSTRYDARSGG